MKKFINSIIAVYAATKEALAIDFAVLDLCDRGFIFEYQFMMFCRKNEYKDFVYDYLKACYEFFLEN